ncbi:hypothetical protein C8R42DRAFT_646140 [Lentinula raphanica]|nr:hypothetical protein C8R42DRAFT_646140 [Lentinula raphanica]
MDLEDDVQYEAFQKQLRVDSMKCAEGNRRAGGIQTQEAPVKMIHEFIVVAKSAKQIQDEFVDETFLLLFGVSVPGTLVGAVTSQSQQKKPFFAALCTVSTKLPIRNVSLYETSDLQRWSLRNSRSATLVSTKLPIRNVGLYETPDPQRWSLQNFRSATLVSTKLPIRNVGLYKTSNPQRWSLRNSRSTTLVSTKLPIHNVGLYETPDPQRWSLRNSRSTTLVSTKLPICNVGLYKTPDPQRQSLQNSPSTLSVTFWGELKTRRDIALHRARSGLVPGEDALDIVAHTFLSALTEEQILKMGLEEFLRHGERQHTTRNRGNDFLALKLAKLQPHILLHPNKETAIPAMLGVQGEEKAGKGGLKTALEDIRYLQGSTNTEIRKLLSPTQGFSVRRYQCSYSQFTIPLPFTSTLPTTTQTSALLLGRATRKGKIQLAVWQISAEGFAKDPEGTQAT